MKSFSVFLAKESQWWEILWRHFSTFSIILILLISSIGGDAHFHRSRSRSQLLDNSAEDWMHSFKPNPKERAGSVKSEDSTFWYKHAQTTLRNQKLRIVEKMAKNVIFFLGDGMSFSTITAARIFKGQLEGSPFGEEAELNFEQFPHIGLSKSFCIDSQVADSACSATAYMCGTKGNIATVGVKSPVSFRDCRSQMNQTHQATSSAICDHQFGSTNKIYNLGKAGKIFVDFIAWAQAAGKSTGIITTTRVTHASPAGTFAHSADRDWENDKIMRDAGENPDKCDDIAEQLIFGETGRNINVILGGGRRELTPSSVLDVENKRPGRREDGKNLIESWIKSKPNGKTSKYVWNRDQLLSLNTSQVDNVLGLFAHDHMDYVTDADANADPSLPEMTKFAIDVLGKNSNGFVLFVEGGRIDHALHSNKAQKALVETIALDAAVASALELTSEQDTLVIVTADHSHVMTISGYPQRGNPILGFSGISDIDDLPYTTLSFANGPGYKHPDENGERYDQTNDNLEHPDYTQSTGVPLLSETHGGEDVPIFSQGPFAHLFTGVHHQSYIPHAIAFAACLQPPVDGFTFPPHCRSESMHR